jgi:hypothetical protein
MGDSLFHIAGFSRDPIPKKILNHEKHNKNALPAMPGSSANTVNDSLTGTHAAKPPKISAPQQEGRMGILHGFPHAV